MSVSLWLAAALTEKFAFMIMEDSLPNLKGLRYNAEVFIEAFNKFNGRLEFFR